MKSNNFGLYLSLAFEPYYKDQGIIFYFNSGEWK